MMQSRLYVQLVINLSISYWKSRMAVVEALGLNPNDVNRALQSVDKPESFESKSFFRKAGASNVSAENCKKAFDIFDRDKSGALEEADLVYILKGFDQGARDLSSRETDGILRDFSAESGRKIGLEEFTAFLSSA
ncbi:parvalbumin beta-like [Hyperolius riggenbachi]|uniref:parvalbumin beta-like n=1 Tax=Hyperolius riggenbachi TaxID=752182 RepID=UPI0035A3AE3A